MIHPQMKVLSIFFLGLALIIPVWAEGEVHRGEIPEFRKLARIDKEVERVIVQLHEVRFADLKLDEPSVLSALGELNRLGAGEREGGVVNFMVRGVDKGGRLRINAKGLSFAQVIDEICVQAGRSWYIEINEVSGAAMLVLTKMAEN